MITFIVGLTLGLFLGWLRVRVLAKELAATTLQRQTLSTALKRSSELLKKCATTIETQHASIQLNKDLAAFDSASIN